MKKLILKISGWFYRQSPKKKRGQWLIDLLFKFRLAQAAQDRGICGVAFQGDSRIQQGQIILENRNPKWKVYAVSGSKADPDGLRYSAAIIALSGAPVTIIDWAGNDFLQGADVQDVLTAHFAVRQRIAMQGGLVYSYEICPLGLPANDPVNRKIERFNAALRAGAPGFVILLNDILAPGGTMLQKYDSGDHIHWSEAAFTDAVIPRTEAALAARGLP